MKNWPCASETTPTDLAWTMTWAPINAALELSVTRPAIEPLPDCARATGISKIEQARRNRKVQNLRMVTPSNLNCKELTVMGRTVCKVHLRQGFSDPISTYTRRPGERSKRQIYDCPMNGK